MVVDGFLNVEMGWEGWIDFFVVFFRIEEVGCCWRGGELSWIEELSGGSFRCDGVLGGSSCSFDLYFGVFWGE